MFTFVAIDAVDCDHCDKYYRLHNPVFKTMSIGNFTRAENDL